ncbi:MAG: hypothetical protein GX348_02850 [Veillonellaceae bacterium]|jgi:diaminopimelate decarboxylase|nr:hypothetical protein [Veillonellaceae bacterium]
MLFREANYILRLVLIYPVDRINFHGNNKTYSEIELALEARIGCIVVDNFYELDLLNNLTQEKKVKQKILLRVSPGIDALTHHYIKTGMIDSKFGMAIANGQALLGIKTEAQMRLLSAKVI